MKTKILNKNEYKCAAKLLSKGELVAFPTETVYGLGADALNYEAVRKVYLVKQRAFSNPLNLTISSIQMVEKYAAHISDKARILMKNFWPGPLTIILPLKYSVINKIVTAGLHTIAFRMPNNSVTLKMIDYFNRPIVGPSANISGKPSPTNAEHVINDLNGKISAIIVDDSDILGIDSTIIDMSLVNPTILRPGVITKDDLIKVIGNNIYYDDDTKTTNDNKYIHYKPNADVIIVDNIKDFPFAISEIEKKDEPFGIMATDSVLNNQNTVRFKEQFSLGDSVLSASHLLYDGLRYFDMYPEVKTILVQGFPRTGLGIAYMNRLEKAATNHHFFNRYV